LNKPITKKGLVEWLKLWALTSNPNTERQRERERERPINESPQNNNLIVFIIKAVVK
jgi:hypothetical protein